MEGISFSNEHEDDDKEESESKSTSKSADTLGAFLIEHKESDSDKKEKPSLFEEIFKREASVESTNEEQADTAVESFEPQQMPEVIEPLANNAEIEQPLDTLSTAEAAAVEQQIVVMRQAEAEPDDPAGPAIVSFHNKIIEQGMNSDEALNQTIDEIEADQEQQVPVAQNIEAQPDSIEPNVEDDSAAGAQPPQQPPVAFMQPNYGAPQPSFESPAPAVAPRAPEVVTVETRNPSDLLVGGIVGYLIGRRRGRIRTEKRLLPIQEKLEKQVKTMEANIIAKEDAIRAAVRKNTEQAQAMSELYNTTEQLRKTSQKTPEVTVELHSKETQIDKNPVASFEQKRTVPFAETLSKQQLLLVAEKILIDGVPLSNTFEANRISEDGLRRIVGEHLRGGDVSRALRLELIDGEQAFERDPQLRDHAELLQRSTTNSPAVHNQTPTLDPITAEHMHKQATLLAQQAHQKLTESKSKKQQKILDITLAAIITLLICAILGLVILRN